VVLVCTAGDASVGFVLSIIAGLYRATYGTVAHMHTILAIIASMLYTMCWNPHAFIAVNNICHGALYLSCLAIIFSQRR
jgi:hypothetical protein